MSWQRLVADNPDLARFGEARFASRVAYLATVRSDGTPRVHPVTPILGGGHLFVFMDKRSPKGHDLRRTGRFALHSSVEDEEGGQGEFFIAGGASQVDDESLRATAANHAGYEVAASYILFLLSPEEAIGTVYRGDEVLRDRWKTDQ